ncbi:MAG: MBL fold metallo-hydrolase [Bacteroidota bacterium]
MAGFYHLKLRGGVNAYLLDYQDELTLIDTGTPGSEKQIVAFIEEQLGKSMDQLKHIIVTHHHVDHAGSLAAIQEMSAAKVYMHPEDAMLVVQGIGMRKGVIPAPHWFFKLLFYLFIKRSPKDITPAKTDHLIKDDDILPIGKGFQAIHVPGHSQGQVALLYQDYGGLLIAADAATNVMGLGHAPLYENVAQGARDRAKLGRFRFEVAVFGHGRPIMRNAAKKFQKFR